MNTKETEIDGITYTFRNANFFVAKEEAKKIAGLLAGALKVKKKPGEVIEAEEHEAGFDIDIDFNEVRSFIGSKEFLSIEEFVLNHLIATSPENGSIKLNTRESQSDHFSKYRSHYYRVIMEGAAFHFADFLPGGGALLTNINMDQLANLTGNLM